MKDKLVKNTYNANGYTLWYIKHTRSVYEYYYSKISLRIFSLLVGRYIITTLVGRNCGTKLLFILQEEISVYVILTENFPDFTTIWLKMISSLPLLPSFWPLKKAVGCSKILSCLLWRVEGWWQLCIWCLGFKNAYFVNYLSNVSHC